MAYLLRQVIHGRENVALVGAALGDGGAPAQESKPVVEGRGQDALVAVSGDVNVDCAVALAQLLAVGATEETCVGERRGGPAKGVVEGDVLGR